MIELEKVCPRCEDNYQRKYYCDECHGTGHVETEDGKRLLEFLSRRRFVVAQQQ